MSHCTYVGGTLDGQTHHSEHPGREMRRPLGDSTDEVYRLTITSRDHWTYTLERIEPVGD